MLRGERPPLALQLLFLGKHLGYLLERRLAQRGLNRTQAMVLIALGRHPGLKALDLCGPARVEPANVTRTLQSLERLGLLERRPHPTDGRANTIYLTLGGESAARDLAKDMEQLSAELFHAVPPEDLSVLERSLGCLWRVVSCQLSAVSHQPSAVSHQPSAISHQPSVAGLGPHGDGDSPRVPGDDADVLETAQPSAEKLMAEG